MSAEKLATIQVHTLRGLLRVAANSRTDNRKSLTGAWIEPDGTAVATDGQALLAVRNAAECCFTGAAVFIPADDALPLVKAQSACGLVEVFADRLALSGNTRTATIRRDGDEELHMPDWWRSVPGRVTGRSFYFATGDSRARTYVSVDSALVQRAHLAVCDVRNISPKKARPLLVMPNGKMPWVGDCGADILVLAMPYRAESTFGPREITAQCATWRART